MGSSHSCVTVAQIADAARVAVRTVYSSTGQKVDILRELRLPAVNDPNVEITMRAIAATDDPRQVIDITARCTRQAHDAHWSTPAVVIPQYPAEPTAAAVLEAATTEYVKALTGIVERLDQLGRFAPTWTCVAPSTCSGSISGKTPGSAWSAPGSGASTWLRSGWPRPRRGRCSRLPGTEPSADAPRISRMCPRTLRHGAAHRSAGRGHGR